ncbi:MAG: hypothetical protein WC002_04920 [Candidatus Muiribacteriota bacterium]
MKNNFNIEKIKNSPLGYLINMENNDNYYVIYQELFNSITSYILLLKEKKFIKILLFKNNENNYDPDLFADYLDQIDFFADKNNIKHIAYSFLINYDEPSSENLLYSDIFKQKKYSDFELKKYIMRADRNILKADFINTFLKTAPFEIVKFKDYYDKFIDYLDSHPEKEDWDKIELSPEKFLDSFEHSNSIFLIHEDKPVGWLITSSLRENYLNYSSCYLFRDYRNSKGAYNMMANSLLMQDWDKYNFAVCNCIVENKKMINLYKRRLIPHVLSVKNEYMTTKILN